MLKNLPSITTFTIKKYSRFILPFCPSPSHQPNGEERKKGGKKKRAHKKVPIDS